MNQNFKLGESRVYQSPCGRLKLIADFEGRGEIFEAMEVITASLSQKELRGKDGFKIAPGDMLSIQDSRGKVAKFRVFKIIAKMPVLVDPSSSFLSIGLMDRLLMAWQVFTGKFFRK